MAEPGEFGSVVAHVPDKHKVLAPSTRSDKHTNKQSIDQMAVVSDVSITRFVYLDLINTAMEIHSMVHSIVITSN